MLGSFGDADSCRDRNRWRVAFLSPEKMKRSFRQQYSMGTSINAKRLREFPWAVRQFDDRIDAPSSFHFLNAFQRFDGANEHRRGNSFLFADCVEHPMDAVIEVNISKAGFAEQKRSP